MLVENGFDPQVNANFRVQWARVQLLNMYIWQILFCVRLLSVVVGRKTEPKPIILGFGSCRLYRHSNFCDPAARWSPQIHSAISLRFNA